MNMSKALLPASLVQAPNKFIANSIAIFCGILLLSILAQLKIVLPWTPVPITGQTFGVSVLALVWGSRLSLASFAGYLAVGFLGAPVFAGGLSGPMIGPTFGYLMGMLCASWVVGKLSDRGWGRAFGTSLGACYIGSLIIFSCGAFGLSFFIPLNKILIAGVLPFLPGDLLKNIFAALLVSKFSCKN